MLPGLLLAATLYVAPTGHNGNRGTLQKPFATIAKGVAALKAGDQLLLRGGTYNEAVNLTGKKRVRIAAYPGEKPVIDGAGIMANGLVIVTLSQQIQIEGLEIRNGPKSGVLLYDVEDVQVRGNDIHHHFRYGVHVVTGSERKRGATRRVLIERNRVHHNVGQNANGRAREWMQGIGTFRAAQVEIRENEVFENFGEGIDAVLTDRVTIANNTVWDNFSANVYLDNATRAVVDANTITSGRAEDPRRYYRGGHPAPAIFAANEEYSEQNPLRDLTITNNKTSGCKYGFGYGDFQHGGGLHRTRIANNTFRGATDHVLYIEPAKHDTTVIENNVFLARDGGEDKYVPEKGIVLRGNCWKEPCGSAP